MHARTAVGAGAQAGAGAAAIWGAETKQVTHRPVDSTS
jgi:hypothetical protein